jgi:hypothetical protein
MKIIKFIIMMIAYLSLLPQGIIYIPKTYPFIIGMGFPILFTIKNKLLKIWSIVICLIAMAKGGSWIGWECIGLFLLIKSWQKNRLLAIFIIIFGILFGMIGGNFLNQNRNLFKDFKTRIELYDYTLSNWKHIWIGEGINTFSKLPQNKSIIENGTVIKKGTKFVESDLIQGFYEFGVLKMMIILFLILLPLKWIGYDYLSISYLCLLLQGIIDLPFHRTITGILGIIIIGLMYCKRRKTK